MPPSLPWDREAALSALGEDGELLIELASFFVTDLPRLLGDVDAAIAAGDAPAVERRAHSIKGAVANFQAPASVAAAQRVEDCGRVGDLLGARAASSQLAAELDRLQGALRTWLRDF